MDNEELNQQLIDAVSDADKERVKNALSKGADVNARDNMSWTPLMLAAGNDHISIAELLINEGANINARTNDGKTALMFAAAEGNKEIVELLVERGADVNTRDNLGWTALMEAAKGGHTDVVRFLIEKGAEVNTKSNSGYTALMWAAFDGHKDIVELLFPKSGGLEVVRKQMRETIRKEKDPLKRFELKINFTGLYRKVLSMVGKETKLGDVKTMKLPPKDKGKFRMQRVRNGS